MEVYVNGEKVGDVTDSGEFIWLEVEEGSFWDFLDYQMPHERMYDLCGDDLICMADRDFAEMLDGIGMDWLYKWVNHSIDIVYDGFVNTVLGLFLI